VLEGTELIKFSLEIKLSPTTHKKFQDNYNKFIKTIHPEVLTIISKHLPNKYLPPKTGPKEICSKVFSPPVIACILGIIIGLISPVKEVLFSNWGNQIFMKTASSLGSMSVPIGNMLLGCKFTEGFLIGKDMNVRKIDLVMMIIIKLVILPALGLSYMALLTNFGIPQIDQTMYSILSSILIGLFLLLLYFSHCL
jgi:hypothetical protein